jgi:hypothetical protein
MDASNQIVEAAKQLPAYAGIAWRSAGFELNAPFDSPDLISLSRDLRVATENFRAGGVHMFITSNSRDLSALSAHPAEHAQALRRGCCKGDDLEPEARVAALPFFGCWLVSRREFFIRAQHQSEWL